MKEMVVGNIDITELLEHYVEFLAISGIPKDSTESKIMLEAAAEIKRVRDQRDFQIRLADDNNKSRLRLLDVLDNGRELCEAICNDKATQCVVCRKIKECSHAGEVIENCCFFDNNKFMNVVFRSE